MFAYGNYRGRVSIKMLDPATQMRPSTTSGATRGQVDLRGGVIYL
jgi:hypothetical protein